MFDYQDTLSELDKNTPLSEKLCSIHNTLKQRYDFIDRIAVAIYDEKTDELKTFINSSGPDQPLTHYQSRLSDSKSLQEILKQGRPRVINDLGIFSDVKATHAQRISSQGYQASYTMPMYANSVFIGFIFFNSYKKDPFDAECLHYLDLFGHLTSLLISSELSNFRTLMSTLKATKHIAHFRDVETGAHLDRMSHYSRIIAQDLAGQYGFSDEYIEHIFMFSPLHDVGKIGVPDNILLKPAGLTAKEFETIKLHTSQGREIIDAIMEDFSLDTFKNVDMLRNITELHHEAIDGSGYPKGLKGEDIPIEARIISVADMFDALTSVRPYKERWGNDDAYAMLQKLAGIKLDKDCVQALIHRRADVEKIQARFYEAHF